MCVNRNVYTYRRVSALYRRYLFVYFIQERLYIWYMLYINYYIHIILVLLSSFCLFLHPLYHNHIEYYYMTISVYIQTYIDYTYLIAMSNISLSNEYMHKPIVIVCMFLTKP